MTINSFKLQSLSSQYHFKNDRKNTTQIRKNHPKINFPNTQKTTRTTETTSKMIMINLPPEWKITRYDLINKNQYKLLQTPKPPQKIYISKSRESLKNYSIKNNIRYENHRNHL